MSESVASLSVTPTGAGRALMGLRLAFAFRRVSMQQGEAAGDNLQGVCRRQTQKTMLG